MRRGCQRPGRLDAGMAAEEFDFPLDDVVEGDSAVVDVVVAALAAVKFCLGCAICDGERGPDRCLGVGFGDDGGCSAVIVPPSGCASRPARAGA